MWPDGKQQTWQLPPGGLPRAAWTKLRSLSVKEIAGRLVPRRINVAVYKVNLAAYKAQSLAEVDVQIEKSSMSLALNYKALIDGQVAHRSTVRAFSMRPVQFGFGAKPVIVDCVTLPEYRGLHIYPHVLSYIIQDLQTTSSIREVYIWADVKNRSSIRAIERAGFEFVAYCHGILIGPLMLGRTLRYDHDDLPDTRK